MPRATQVPTDTPEPPASGLCSCPECAPGSGASRCEHLPNTPCSWGRSQSVSAGQRPFGKRPRKFGALATRTPPNTPCSEIRGDADGEPETINEGSGETQQQRTASTRREGAPAKPSVIHVQVDRDRVPVVGPASATSSTVPHLRFTRHAASAHFDARTRRPRGFVPVPHAGSAGWPLCAKLDHVGSPISRGRLLSRPPERLKRSSSPVPGSGLRR